MIDLYHQYRCLTVSQILAWNGGGISNYTSIVEEGGYAVQSRESRKTAGGAVPSLQELEHEIEKLAPHMYETKEHAKETLTKFMHEMVDDVIDEMKAFNHKSE